MGIFDKDVSSIERKQKEKGSPSLREGLNRAGATDDTSSLFGALNSEKKPIAYDEVDGLRGNRGTISEEAKSLPAPESEVMGLLKDKSLTSTLGEKEEPELTEAESAIDDVAKQSLKEAQKAPKLLKKKKKLPPPPTPDVSSNVPAPTPGQWLDIAKGELANRRDAMIAIYEDNKNTRAWAEVAETFGHALTQFFAARQGLKDNVDMSGLQFAKTDWVAKSDAALKELDMKMKDLGNQEASIDREKETMANRVFQTGEREAREASSKKENQLNRNLQLTIPKLRTAESAGNRKEAAKLNAEVKRGQNISRLMNQRKANMGRELDDARNDLEEILSTEGESWYNSNDEEAARIKAAAAFGRLRSIGEGSSDLETKITAMEEKLEKKGIESFPTFRKDYEEAFKEAQKSAHSYDIAAGMIDQRTSGTRGDEEINNPSPTSSSNGEKVMIDPNTRIKWITDAQGKPLRKAP
jgi:hypothetical protein